MRKNRPVGGIPADARVLARDVRRRDDADVDRIGDAAAADRDRVLDDVVGVLAGVVVVLDAREDGTARRSAAPVHGLLSRRGRAAGVDRRDAARALADAEVGAGRQDQLRIDQEVALVHVAVGVGEEVDLPVAGGVADLRPARRRASGRPSAAAASAGSASGARRSAPGPSAPAGSGRCPRAGRTRPGGGRRCSGSARASSTSAARGSSACCRRRRR